MSKRTELKSEHEEQCALIEWTAYAKAKHPELKWLYTVPNGAKLPYRKSRDGKRFSREAMWLKREGLRPGVSDLHLPVACGAYIGLWIEMKVGYNKTTDYQQEWLDDMNSIGHYAVVCYGFEEAKEVLEKYLNLKDGEKIKDEET